MGPVVSALPPNRVAEPDAGAPLPNKFDDGAEMPPNKPPPAGAAVDTGAPPNRAPRPLDAAAPPNGADALVLGVPPNSGPPPAAGAPPIRPGKPPPPDVGAGNPDVGGWLMPPNSGAAFVAC